MSGEDWLILDLLGQRIVESPDAQRVFGLELVEASKGRLRRGRIYVNLDRLETIGLLESQLEHVIDGVPRRSYRLTAKGIGVWNGGERMPDRNPMAAILRFFKIGKPGG